LNTLKDLLEQYKGKRAIINYRESELYSSLVVEIQPNMPPDRSTSVIEGVTDELLILNYYDAKELHYIPLSRILKAVVILRESNKLI
jgi:hypothetical protein